MQPVILLLIFHRAEGNSARGEGLQPSEQRQAGEEEEEKWGNFAALNERRRATNSQLGAELAVENFYEFCFYYSKCSKMIIHEGHGIKHEKFLCRRKKTSALLF